MLSILTSVCSALMTFRLPSRRVQLLMVTVALFGTLYADEYVAIEFGGYKLGTYYLENEEQTEAGPILLPRKVFKFDRVYVEYDWHSRLRRYCFVTPTLKDFHNVQDYGNEIRFLANTLVKRYPCLVKEGESEKSITFSCNSRCTWISIYENGFSIFLDVGDTLTKVPLSPLRKPTTPITNLFSVVLGSPIGSVKLPTKPLKKELLGCQYSFTPPKQFRLFDNYYLKVKDGVVVGIYGVYYPPKEVNLASASSKKDKKDIVDLLKEKFKVRFVWGDEHWLPHSRADVYPTNSKENWPWYRGIGKDFTYLFLKDGYVRIGYRDKRYLCLGLETEWTRQRDFDRLNGIKKSNDKRRQTDLDAL